MNNKLPLQTFVIIGDNSSITTVNRKVFASISESLYEDFIPLPRMYNQVFGFLVKMGQIFAIYLITAKTDTQKNVLIKCHICYKTSCWLFDDCFYWSYLKFEDIKVDRFKTNPIFIDFYCPWIFYSKKRAQYLLVRIPKGVLRCFFIVDMNHWKWNARNCNGQSNQWNFSDMTLIINFMNVG